MTGIVVYKDTVISHDDNDNLAEIFVSDDFAEKYFKECQAEYYDNIEDFFNEYTADNTEDFYEYAKKHGAILEIKDLKFKDCNFNML